MHLHSSDAKWLCRDIPQKVAIAWDFKAIRKYLDEHKEILLSLRESRNHPEKDSFKLYMSI